jgi:DNA-binding transcriptional MerR regulator
MSQEERGYRIGQVASRLGVRSSTLRFWETVFPEVRPQRGPGGQRLYSPEAVEMLQRIKTLVHEEGLTLAGARRRLLGWPAAGELSVIVAEMEHLLHLLTHGPTLVHRK